MKNTKVGHLTYVGDATLGKDINIGCGTRLGISSAFGDPRGRQESLMGIFWIVVAGVLVIHARQIVGMGAS